MHKWICCNKRTLLFYTVKKHDIFNQNFKRFCNIVETLTSANFDDSSPKMNRDKITVGGR